VKGEGVSSTVGAIMLISVAVLAMGIVVLFLFSTPLPTSVPAFTGIISNSSMIVYISHEGGDTLYVGQFKILVDGVDRTSNFTQSITGPFSLGKVMKANVTYYPSRVVLLHNTSTGGETVLLSANLLGAAPFTPPGWYSSSWLFRKKITIRGSQVTGSHTDFPVLIYLVDGDLQFDALAGGNDILFTSWDGTTRIPHEIEFFNKQSGSLTAWVKVPSLTSGVDTVIYVYYDNPGASSQQDPANVWTNGYAGVWHLNSSFADSTSHAYNGVNTATTDQGGQIGRARGFDGTGNQYITISGLLGSPATVTMSAWARLTAADTLGSELASMGDNVSVRINHPTDKTFGFYRNSTEWPRTLSGVTVTTATWHHIVYIANPAANSEAFYIDGELKKTTGYGIEAIVYQPSLNTIIGKHPLGTSWDFNGIIDEVRVSSTARSQDWIATEYTNQNNPAGFITISTEQGPLTMS